MSLSLALGGGVAHAAVLRLAARWQQERAVGALLAEALSVTRAPARPETADEELLERARRNEPEAVHAIYQRHAAAVYRRLTHLLGADPEREDLMQEVFVSFFQDLKRFRGASTLRTYLLRIVSHKVCDHLRRRQRRRRALGEGPPVVAVDGTEGAQASSAAPSPEERLSHAQELTLVEAALEKLTPKKRIAFLLRTVDNLSLKEIAEQVGATVFTVAQRVRHADRELHRHLERARRGRP